MTLPEAMSESRIIEQEAASARREIRRTMSELKGTVTSTVRRNKAKTLLLGSALMAVGAGAFVASRRLRSDHAQCHERNASRVPAPGLLHRLSVQLAWMVIHTAVGAWFAQLLNPEE